MAEDQAGRPLAASEWRSRAPRAPRSSVRHCVRFEGLDHRAHVPHRVGSRGPEASVSRSPRPAEVCGTAGTQGRASEVAAAGHRLLVASIPTTIRQPPRLRRSPDSAESLPATRAAQRAIERGPSSRRGGSRPEPRACPSPSDLAPASKPRLSSLVRRRRQRAAPDRDVGGHPDDALRADDQLARAVCCVAVSGGAAGRATGAPS